MGKEIMVMPLPKLLFDPREMEPLFIKINDVECKTNKDLKHTNSLYLYNFELGNTLVFYQKGKLRSSNILELPISAIISTEVSNIKKRIGKKWILTIKTSKETIVIHAEEKQVNAFKRFLDGQKNKQTLANETKKITLTSGGSTKILTIHPYSPEAHDGEDHLFSQIPTFDLGFLITNYRVFMDDFLTGKSSKTLTHEEYEDVIASNVERRREEDIVGGVNSRSSLWNLLQPRDAPFQYDISYNKSAHHASSTEIEVGDIIFMNDGKQVMEWENILDPHSLVKIINSAKAHFSTTPTAPSSSGGEDPIKALKLRFAKGEITKEEFLEMKSMLG